MRYVLLLRAVNLGPTNKLPMADLRALLEDVGHTEVRTVLNSGNAIFTSSRRSASALAAEVEQALATRGLPVRACVRTSPQLQAALDCLPADLPAGAYVLVCVLFDEPASTQEVLAKAWPGAVRQVQDPWTCSHHVVGRGAGPGATWSAGEMLRQEHFVNERFQLRPHRIAH